MSSRGEPGAGAALITVTETCSCSAKPSGCKGLRTPFSYTASTCISMALLYAFRGASAAKHDACHGVPSRGQYLAQRPQPRFDGGSVHAPRNGNLAVSDLLTFRHRGAMTKARRLY
jgi:hypothetical protein